MKKDFRYDAALLSRASFPAVLEAGNRPCIVETTVYRLNAVAVTSLMLDGFEPLLNFIGLSPDDTYITQHEVEDMNALEIAAGIRWHYENGYNLLSDSTALPDEPAEPEEAVELTLTIGPDQAKAIAQEVVKTVRPAIDYAVKKAHEFTGWAIQTAGELAKLAAESLSKFMDAMLYSVNTHPKWWHLYKHAKKYRVRKKYRKRLMQQLVESLRAAPDPLEVIT